jgi:predicted DNA-binding transcriptional regulator YafY
MPEKDSRQTLLRQWEMLKLLPKAPSPQMTVRQIRERLTAAGFAVDDRTVQRDLKALAAIFLIDVQDRAPPYGWRWNRDAHFDIPSMPLAEALVLEMVEQYLQPLLPLSQLGVLNGLFRASRQKLDAAGDANPLCGWANRVRVIQAAQPLIPPPVDEAVQLVIYEALLKRKQVEVNYRNSIGELKENMILHLLALVQRGPITYLVARARNYTDNRLFDLHRIEVATLLDDPIKEPKDFDLDEYLASGALEFSSKGESMRLEIRLTDKQAKYLSETPLSTDQVVSADTKEGWSRLVATVNDTEQLRWWLRAMGDRCEVAGPPCLREEFVKMAREMTLIYREG